jgi:polysaccharide export outer membrane protein
MKVSRLTIIIAALIFPCLSIAAQPAVTTPAQNTTQTLAPAQTPPTATAGAGAVLGPTVAPGVIPATYVVGPEDSISITVWHEPSLSGSFPVRPDGMISLALVGDIMAAGRTPMDLANDLTARLKNFVNDPTVTVSVLAVNSKRVYMLGEVAHIGPISLTSSLTPLQAISAAGGLSQYASKTKIYILRVDASGKKIKIPFNYKKAIKTGDLQGVTLLPGDTIVVP